MEEAKALVATHRGEIVRVAENLSWSAPSIGTGYSIWSRDIQSCGWSMVDLNRILRELNQISVTYSRLPATYDELRAIPLGVLIRLFDRPTPRSQS